MLQRVSKVDGGHRLSETDEKPRWHQRLMLSNVESMFHSPHRNNADVPAR